MPENSKTARIARRLGGGRQSASSDGIHMRMPNTHVLHPNTQIQFSSLAIQWISVQVHYIASVTRPNFISGSSIHFPVENPDTSHSCVSVHLSWNIVCLRVSPVRIPDLDHRSISQWKNPITPMPAFLCTSEPAGAVYESLMQYVSIWRCMYCTSITSQWRTDPDQIENSLEQIRRDVFTWDSSVQTRLSGCEISKLVLVDDWFRCTVRYWNSVPYCTASATVNPLENCGNPLGSDKYIYIYYPLQTLWEGRI